VTPPERAVVVPYDYSHDRTRLAVDTLTGRFWSRPVDDLDAAGVLNEPGRDPLDRMAVTSSPKALVVVLRCDGCGDETAVARRPTDDGIGPPLTLAELVRAARGHTCDEEDGL
jgi:hypothetical protein